MNPNDADPAIVIAREWYNGMELIVDGVDFGKCCTYDVLQIINRSILRREQEDKEQEDKEKVEAKE